jgi:hypothetical protein
MSAEPDASKPLGGGGRPTPKEGSFEMLVVGRMMRRTFNHRRWPRSANREEKSP